MKKKYGIISNFDDLCGNAAYSMSLEKILSNDFDIHRLDVTNITKIYDSKRIHSIINNVTEGSKECDYVNVQLEVGLYGNNFISGYNNIKKIIKNVKPKKGLSITFHRVFNKPRSNENIFLKHLISLKLISLLRYVRRELQCRVLNRKYLTLVKVAIKKNSKIIVHTKRDLNYLKLTIGDIPNIIYHPIIFSNEISNSKITDYTRYSPALAELDPDIPTVGVFGFISEYKNIEIVINSCKTSEANLIIFGQIHPSARYENPFLTNKSSYIEKLNRMALGEFPNSNNIFKLPQNILNSIDKNISKVTDLKNKGQSKGEVRFMSGLKDNEFFAAMKMVDLIVVPYWETGQSGSGIVSLAIQSKSRLILSDTESFYEIADEVDGWVPIIDPANISQLSNLITQYKTIPKTNGFKNHNEDTLRKAYTEF